jgi:hypothetical protein
VSHGIREPTGCARPAEQVMHLPGGRRVPRRYHLVKTIFLPCGVALQHRVETLLGLRHRQLRTLDARVTLPASCVEAWLAFSCISACAGAGRAAGAARPGPGGPRRLGGAGTTCAGRRGMGPTAATRRRRDGRGARTPRTRWAIHAVATPAREASSRLTDRPGLRSPWRATERRFVSTDDAFQRDHLFAFRCNERTCRRVPQSVDSREGSLK